MVPASLVQATFGGSLQARNAAAESEDHRLVYCALATVDPAGRPRTRVVHPVWSWTGTELTGWVLTNPRSPKREHLDGTRFASCTYTDRGLDSCTADCAADFVTDDAVRAHAWSFVAATPPPGGYDPAALGIPGWSAPDDPGFAVVRLRPWRLRVDPLSAGPGREVLWWRG